MTLKSAHTGKIGKAFKNARTYRDLSLREVALKTFINIDYIKRSIKFSKIVSFDLFDTLFYRPYLNPGVS